MNRPTSPTRWTSTTTSLTDAEREQLRAVLAEFASREMEALHLFEPMDEQERFFASNADERVGLGGNRGGKTTASASRLRGP
jgi:hypothetical protein